MLCAATLLLSSHRKSQEKQQRKQEALENLEKLPTVTPSLAPSISPTPIPSPTPTPTPAVTKTPAFAPEQYAGLWYSGDGLASVDIYELTEKKVSFFFSQANNGGTRVSEADVTAEVAGNASQFTFTDSFGSQASGSMVFDQNGLYFQVVTTASAGPVSPAVNGMLTRERKEPSVEPQPTEAPTPTSAPEQTGDYYFPESDSRYLTEEELSRYSSSELELAKNEIYARHGRKFVTQRIADYFNSKAWYQGTIEPEEFDAMQDSVFNEYEMANIEMIAAWEAKKREEGN